MTVLCSLKVLLLCFLVARLARIGVAISGRALPLKPERRVLHRSWRLHSSAIGQGLIDDNHASDSDVQSACLAMLIRDETTVRGPCSFPAPRFLL
ncbi:hypothetical protein [Cupriavidus sp. BIS7]|uniref:hypothetical protein n=1 Tax=Cupriavidus sp. BIS7 TaxID=1217718 RepID=UPI0012F66E96|nr:hypothetical protein [Cupriavidus sp. BIS7]